MNVYLELVKQWREGKTGILGEKPVSGPLVPQQIPNGQAWD